MKQSNPTRLPSCLFVHDFKFIQDGKSVYGDGQFEYKNLWKKKYLSLFSTVAVIARGSQVPGATASPHKYKLSGDSIRFVSTPSLASLQGIFSIRKVKKILEKEINKHDIVIVRLPSLQGLVACSVMSKRKDNSYIIESVGNSFSALWYHGGVTAKLIAPIIHLLTKLHIRKASNVIYVTKEYLQKIYPNKNNNIGCSDVIISSFDHNTIKKRLSRIKSYNNQTTYKLGLVGSYNVSYKGHGTAIKALSKINHPVKLHLLGSGEIAKWKSLANRYGVATGVEFDSPVSAGKEMENWLDSLDILLIPSKTEGMPRILIEAMSRGLVVIGSDVGDIPCVINKNQIVPYNKWHVFAQKINYVLSNKEVMREISIENFEKSKDFSLDLLQKHRNDFITEILSRSTNQGLKS